MGRFFAGSVQTTEKNLDGGVSRQQNNKNTLLIRFFKKAEHEKKQYKEMP